MVHEALFILKFLESLCLFVSLFFWVTQSSFCLLNFRFTQSGWSWKIGNATYDGCGYNTSPRSDITTYWLPM